MKKQVMCAVVVGLFAAMSIPAFAAAIALDVPNHSFETPETNGVLWDFDGWASPGETGIFSNSAGYGDFIANADGRQIVYMNCRPESGGDKNNIHVDLPYSLIAGKYTLTVGVAGRSDSAPTDKANTKMELRLFTRVPELTILAQKEVVYSGLSNTALTYYSATLDAADIPAAAMNQGFGIWLISTVGSTGGDWTLDNVSLTVIPMTATNPIPTDGQIGVGTATGTNSDVEVELGWSTGTHLDDQVNPNITTHYLYLAAGEPNFVSVSPIAIPAGTPTAATASYAATLIMDETYFWRVDESINGSVASDPNTIRGLVWSFETLKSIPVIISHPQNQQAVIGDTAELAVEVFSISPEVYSWYKSVDNVNNTIDDDTLIGTNSNTLTLANVSLADEGYYYCVVSNVSETPVSSNTAFFEIRRLTAWYAFENDLLDSAGDNDGSALKVDPNIPFDYTDGKIGKAIVLNGIDEAVGIPRTIQDSFTIILWVKTTALGGDGGWWTGKGLVDGDIPGGVNDFGTSLRSSKFAFGVGPDTTISSASDINDNEWRHCVATRDHVTGEMKVYVDGVLETTATGPMGSKDAPDALRIGKIRSGANYLDGQMDDVKLYNYKLSDLEIARSYNAMTGQSVCLTAIQPSLDLNDDCKVDLGDFAMLANQWLDCALVPDCIQ